MAYTVSEFIGVDALDDRYQYSELNNVVYVLSELSKAIDKLGNIDYSIDVTDEHEVEMLLVEIEDIADILYGAAPAINDAVNVIDLYTDVPHIIERWENEVQDRFSIDEYEEYSQELTMRALKGQD